MPSKKYNNGRHREKNANDNEILGIVMVIVSAFLLLCIIVTPVLGVISKLIFRVTTGIFGLFAYPLFLSTLLWGVALIQGRKMSLSVRARVLIGLMAFSLMMILQLATTHSLLSNKFSSYIGSVYHGTTAGGVLFGTVAYGIQSVITPVVSYLLFSLAFVGLGAMLAYPLFKNRVGAPRSVRQTKEQQIVSPFVKGNATAQPVKPMTDTTLFVDTIRPTAENVKLIERYDEEPQGRVATVTDFASPAIQTPQKSEGAFKSDAHRILFGDHERYMSNLSAQNAAMPKLDYAQEQREYLNNYTLPPLSAEPDVKDTTVNAKAEEPPAPVRPQKRVHVEGLREIPLLPEKDISDQIVGGTIINGEDLSEELAERMAPVKEEKKVADVADERPQVYDAPRAVDFSVRKAEPTRLRPREQAASETALPPIMNGDYFTVDPVMPAKPMQADTFREEKETLSPFASIATEAIKPTAPESDETQTPIISASEYEREHSPEARFQQLLNEERSKRDDATRDVAEEEPFIDDFERGREPAVLTIDDEPEDLSEQSHFEGTDSTGYYEPVTTDPPVQPFAPKPVHAKVTSVAGQTSIDEYMTNVPAPPVKKRRKSIKYMAPSLDMLIPNDTVVPSDNVECTEKGQLLESTLRELKLPATVIGITRGPAVTRYELEMPPGTPIKRIEQYSADIAYNLASNGKIRIETPIPGKRAVGVEVPNSEIDMVRLHEIIGSKEFQNSSSPLTIALGKDIAGSKIICNLEKMPHLLIAGSTGSGKSACLNSIIMSILYKASPDDVRLILVDPKRVEFNMYRGLPHLISNEIINETSQAINALTWARDEMERRYILFGKHCVRNLQEFNKCDAVKDGTEQKIPYIVMIVDELAELMLDNNRKELENKIMSIAQKARAAGIHLILATQRPTVDVITGTIKANLPSRIAFAVKSMVDSRTILDECGAETLLGRGDMLYAPQGVNEPIRVQGAFVTNEEVGSVTEFVRLNNEADFDDEFTAAINKKDEPEESDGDEVEEKEFDDLMPQVLKCVIESGSASTSMVQRRFSVGYARASRIIDQMELHKFISPQDGSKPRSVYISREQYKELFGIDL